MLSYPPEAADYDCAHLGLFHGMFCSRLAMPHQPVMPACISPAPTKPESYLEDKLYDMVAQRAELRHVILMCTAVNEIDASALESLEAIKQRLEEVLMASYQLANGLPRPKPLLQ